MLAQRILTNIYYYNSQCTKIIIIIATIGTTALFEPQRFLSFRQMSLILAAILQLFFSNNLTSATPYVEYSSIQNYCCVILYFKNAPETKNQFRLYNEKDWLNYHVVK